MTTKIIYNNCYGGFGLSDLAEAALLRAGCTEEEVYDFRYENRHDPRLVHVVETMGSELASGECAELRVDTISGDKYRVCEYDGVETVQTPVNIKWVDVTATLNP